MSLAGKKIGFIGTGKMGSALIKGISGAGIVPCSGIYASDVFEASLRELRDSLGVNVTQDNREVVNKSDIIVLAVKPQILKSVLSSIKDDITGDKLMISIAAGVKLEAIENELSEGTHVVRVMPNIAATVAEAASAVAQGKYASAEDAEDVLNIFRSVGSAISVPENLMDAVTGLSGSGPAFIFPVIEAMADGGVYEGLDRNSALILAAQTVLGAAKMMLETNTHPGQLKDMVTSPGGTTIRGIYELEESGIRAAFMKAVIASSNRSKELGK
ncbi:pyrroline-5-carboxylate reductase [Methanolobus chelungpuianus]|uniref:Pyrroline-5-carboxylate reductase n=1 Tax=Methanolobus chelungpuianus TaxID=502115 RepID=A0AAE3KZL5_9EURY|nr:pyrroline-5-carboxylate reductase [Methanolobus chelungpuianus]MCQ6962588.1 pyrroline-5-carboxylate reductase [Methanolobus chelungpuianus]